MASEAPETPNFGQRYVILNLDWMALLLGAVETTPEGQALIQRTTLKGMTPSTKIISSFDHLHNTRFYPWPTGSGRWKAFCEAYYSVWRIKTGTPETKIDKRFIVDENDVILAKTRWSATSGSAPKQILKAQNIDTVIISGLSLSGVLMSTIYHLFELDYDIYVIEGNVLELPPSDTTELKRLFSSKASLQNEPACCIT
ncbi:hypothetical protein N7481_000417 [Penicillium waksmanii]|uniref:uncharacterized protein n=1 Tax=Penicillium waksmanii TaxID=69791 RepID=UPI0025488E54|nr:uncharacterized protein N7481_000417 [Penicillium waksmanii]KAJ6000008.1 hypothetical protein N7481_000417 [Penicillium waksmanii]